MIATEEQTITAPIAPTIVSPAVAVAVAVAVATATTTAVMLLALDGTTSTMIFHTRKHERNHHYHRLT